MTQKTTAKKKAPAKTDPPRKWVADFGDLTIVEFDRVLEITGLSFGDFKSKPGTFLAATAVVLRQREEPVPDDAWKTLRFADLDIRNGLSVEDFDSEDPTPRA